MPLTDYWLETQKANWLLILEPKIIVKNTKPLPIKPTIDALENVSKIPKKIIIKSGILDSLSKKDCDWKKNTSQNPIMYKNPYLWLPTWFLAAYPSVARSYDRSSFKLLSDK